MDQQKCTGWWEQNFVGRHDMKGLMVTIDGNKISGSGFDVVGTFTFEGTLEDNNDVFMVKQYLGQHTVRYKGEYNGRDHMWGVWSLSWDQGPWEIRLTEASSEQEKNKKKQVVKNMLFV
ncbi:MAG: hypothetical protein AAFY71_16115 [Bacteroidota bacterium]